MELRARLKRPLIPGNFETASFDSHDAAIPECLTGNLSVRFDLVGVVFF
jgi:hypothetical protein